MNELTVTNQIKSDGGIKSDSGQTVTVYFSDDSYLTMTVAQYDAIHALGMQFGANIIKAAVGLGQR